MIMIGAGHSLPTLFPRRTVSYGSIIINDIHELNVPNLCPKHMVEGGC